MPTNTSYATLSDLLVGDVTLPSYVDQQKMLNDAADEVDSHIGFIYQTPIDFGQSGLSRPVKLIIKRITAHLATGRLLLLLDSAGEDDRVHAYGQSLIKTAMDALQAIESGKIVLEGATPSDPTANVAAGPQIYNKDPESNVEAFYDRLANPWFSPYGFLGESYPWPPPYDPNHGLVR